MSSNQHSVARSVAWCKPTVIVPAYNEEETVAAVVSTLRGLGLAVTVIDDGSSDQTAKFARGAGAAVVQLPMNLGVGGALRCGFRWAVLNGYDTVVQCDADGQHDPDQITDLLDLARTTHAHLTIGSRFSGAGGFEATPIRRIPIAVLSRIATRSARTQISDPTSGFRVIREPLLSEFARAFPVHYLGDTFGALVQAGKAGYRITEAPIVMRHRAGGTPSAGTWASVRFLARALLTIAVGSGPRYRRPDDLKMLAGQK